MSKKQEKRRSPRYDFDLRILFRKHDAAYFYETRTENISADGVFLQTRHQQLDVGTPVLLMLSGEEFGGSIPIKGRVAWTRDTASDLEGPAGMGIAFEGVEEDRRRLIGDALERIATDEED